MTPNPFLLAADNSPTLLPLLQGDPALASSQDEHGYSLVHAAASYNHCDLLRILILELHVDVNLKDEDDETALFVTETPNVAKVLVEELGVDIKHRNSEGLTAREKIEAEGEFPEVAMYLAHAESSQETPTVGSPTDAKASDILPNGMAITIGNVDQDQDIPPEVDHEFRRRIEELAQRDDFDTALGQTDLRRLVEDAIMDQGLGDERNARPRQS